MIFSLRGGFPMKRLSAVVLWLIFCFASPVFADEKQDLWMKAAAERNPELRLQYFEEFLEKFGGEGSQTGKYLFLNLSQAAFQLKQYNKAIEYGEKALEFQDMEANFKLQSYLILANAFYLTKSDLEKAFLYAGLTIEFGKTLKMDSAASEHSDQLNQNIDENFISPGYRLQTHILYEKANDNPTQLIEAISKAVEAQKFHRTDRNSELVLSLAYKLAKFDRLDKAIFFVEQLCENEEANEKSFNMLGTWYSKKGEKEKAINYFEKAYQMQKKDDKAAKTALNIGVLLVNQDKRKAMDYFAEAYLLFNSDKESNAYKYLEQIWFNDLAKGKPREDQEQGLASVVAAARVRLGIDG